MTVELTERQIEILKNALLLYLEEFPELEGPSGEEYRSLFELLEEQTD